MEQLTPVVGTAAACRSLDIARATGYRHRRPRVAKGPSASPGPPPRALSYQERRQVLDVLHQPRFVDKAPAEIYATLLDEGRYLCSIRTMYRILHEAKEVCERRNQLRHPVYTKPQLVATGPNQVWLWEITKLLGPAKWTYFSLDVILDIFSRFVIGWMLAPRESGALAERLIRETVLKWNTPRTRLVVHSDHGPSMRSQTVAQLLATLGISKSHSRPQVSDHNPFSEAQFKTLKYRPEFPRRFASFEHGLDLCRRFFPWYDFQDYHWGLGLSAPAMVHFGLADQVLTARHRVLDAAHTAHPEHFVRKPPKPLPLPDAVWINPPTRLPKPTSETVSRSTNSKRPAVSNRLTRSASYESAKQKLAKTEPYRKIVQTWEDAMRRIGNVDSQRVVAIEIAEDGAIRTECEPPTMRVLEKQA